MNAATVGMRIGGVSNMQEFIAAMENGDDVDRFLPDFHKRNLSPMKTLEPGSLRRMSISMEWRHGNGLLMLEMKDDSLTVEQTEGMRTVGILVIRQVNDTVSVASVPGSPIIDKMKTLLDKMTVGNWKERVWSAMVLVMNVDTAGDSTNFEP